MSDTFEQQVIAKLSTLETQMEMLVGNGQPGRIHNIEAKVRRHERLLWVAAGGALALGYGASEAVRSLVGLLS